MSRQNYYKHRRQRQRQHVDEAFILSLVRRERRTDEGFMYLSLIMDSYSRAILGYDCSDSLEAEGALRSLSMALRHLKDCVVRL